MAKKRYMAWSKNGVREISEAEAIAIKTKNETIREYGDKVMNGDVSIDDVPVEYKDRIKRYVRSKNR